MLDRLDAAAVRRWCVTGLEALRTSGRISAGSAIALGPADEVSHLPALVTAPSDPVRLGAANRALERLGVPWRFGARKQSAIDASGPGFSTVAVAERYELLPQAGAEADTLASAARAPWIVAGPRYVLVGSPLVATASALPVRAAFIPWLAATISERLSGEPGVVLDAAPGSMVARPVGVDQIEQPDGTHVAAADSIRLPLNPGVYFFMSGGKRAGAVVVNTPTAESKLERLTADEMGRLVPSSTVIDAEQPAAVEREAFRAAATRSLLFPVLIAVLVALAVESLLVAAGRQSA